MNRDEFKEWSADFAARFPQIGKKLLELPKETRDIWFDDVFGQFEIEDAIAANRDLMASGGIEAYDLNKLPGIFMQKIQDWQAVRRAEETRLERAKEVARWQQQRENRRQRNASRIGVGKLMDSQMQRALRDLQAIRADYLQEHGEYMPDDEWRAACDAYWAENDLDDPFDPNENPFNEALQESTNE